MDGIFYFIDMFWDIIIQADTHIVVFIVSVNVLFLSNSQLGSLVIITVFRCLS